MNADLLQDFLVEGYNEPSEEVFLEPSVLGISDGKDVVPFDSLQPLQFTDFDPSFGPAGLYTTTDSTDPLPGPYDSTPVSDFDYSPAESCDSFSSVAPSLDLAFANTGNPISSVPSATSASSASSAPSVATDLGVFSAAASPHEITDTLEDPLELLDTGALGYSLLGQSSNNSFSGLSGYSNVASASGQPPSGQPSSGQPNQLTVPMPQQTHATHGTPTSASPPQMNKRKQSDSRISLPTLYKLMHLDHDPVEARHREQKILSILRSLGFKLGEKAWIRDTTQEQRTAIIDEIHRLTYPEFQYDKSIIEIVIRRGSYYLMQGRLRRERRGRARAEALAEKARAKEEAARARGERF